MPDRARANESASAAPRIPARALQRLFEASYGLYAWVVFVLLALAAVLAALTLPGLERRRRTVRACARAFLRAASIEVRVTGEHRLPTQQCVVVANHASYLDGVVMKAVLPPRFAYVVKREMDGFPLAGLLLRRIGTQFVERFDRQRGALDARRVLKTAGTGQSLVFFPEGTFSEEVGLMKFHAGAFTTALRAGCLIVPAVIRGSRAMLPASRLLPRPGRLEVELLEPIRLDATGAIEATAPALRRRARQAILARLGEPDLAPDAPETPDEAARGEAVASRRVAASE